MQISEHTFHASQLLDTTGKHLVNMPREIVGVAYATYCVAYGLRCKLKVIGGTLQARETAQVTGSDKE